ncbi:MAG: cytochrome c oxidase assembly protein subunit 11 [Paracoccaceae bacterium]|jgi:cytochrome c oxidase assembly protein subunit 11
MGVSAQRKTVLRLSALVFTMGALSFAAVPLYSWFCQVTGFGGVTSVASGDGNVEVLDRTIKIRFDSNTAVGLEWEFRPELREVELRIGEVGLAFYEAYNPTDRAIAGTASYNVAPFSAGSYFTKIDCFCFEQQVLQPGERVMMPVTFYVDPEIVDDVEASYVTTITLSYTFYETELPEPPANKAASLDADARSNVN